MIPKSYLTDQFAGVVAGAIVADILKRRKEYSQDEVEWEAEAWREFIEKVADPGEKKFVAVMSGLFEEQKAEVLANMKRAPKSLVKERQIESWLFGRKKWERRFQREGIDLMEGIAVTNGQRIMDDLPVIGVSFDVTNPEVASALKERSIKFSKEVVGTTEERIRATLAEGIAQGESIPVLRDRISAYFAADRIAKRAEMIARNETIWASNAGAEYSYIQSGVVEGKEWLIAADDRTCEFCFTARDDFGPKGSKGPTPLGKAFYEVGDEVTGADGGKMTLSYDTVNWPPLHVRCRCSIVPVLMEAPISPLKPVSSTIPGVAGRIPLCGPKSKAQVSCLQGADVERIQRATKSHLPATREVQMIGEANEGRLASVLKKGKGLPDNEAFDVIVGTVKKPDHLIEVKTIVRGKNNKITMHPDSRRRKLAKAAEHPDAKVHTVVFDERSKQIFYREGVGSFRLGGMKEVTLEDLKGILI